MPDRVIMVRESEWREMREALQVAQKFIASEYFDPSQQQHGEWLAPEARPAYERLCAALAKSEGADDVLLRGRIAYALTKQLVIDMPTARAAVDEAFRNLALTALAKSEAAP